MSNCASDHFRWIGTIADRIICSKSQTNEYPLLSLSFLSRNDKIFDFFSQFSRPNFPITVDKLTDGKLYGVVVSAVAQDKKQLISNDSIQYLFNFELILKRLLNEGYVPQNPCEVTGLTAGRLEDHVNLCKSIEFLVADKSLDINLLKTDLLYVPHSFYVPNEDTKILLIEDAISLWLSKFHCIADFQEEASKNIRRNHFVQLNDKNYSIQMDASKFSKIAGCLSRAFPDKIDRDEIMNGEDEDEVQYNIKISKNILDQIHAFVIEKFPTDEQLFTLFISDLFYATRKGVKKFVPVDHSMLYQPHLPSGSKRMKSPRSLSNKINLNHYMSGTIEALERRKESEEYNMVEANEEEIYKITPYNTLQTIKDREELNMDEANDEEIYKITPYNTLQTIKDHEELNMAEANDEEKYKITPYNTLQTIKDHEELNMEDAQIEERGRITPYSTLQTIKDHEELNMEDAREEESGNITPYSTLQNIKDREELRMIKSKAEEGNRITPYNALQNIKDREETNMEDAREEESSNITPYNTLQNIKDDEERKLQNAENELKFNDLKVPSSNQQKTKNVKIVRPSIEPKSSKNAIGHKTREINNQNSDSSLAEKLNESFNSLNQDQINDDYINILNNNDDEYNGRGQVGDNSYDKNNEDESSNEDQLSQSGSNFSSKSNCSAYSHSNDNAVDENSEIVNDEITADDNNENSEIVNDETTADDNNENSAIANDEITADDDDENNEIVNDEITTPSNDESEFSNKEIPIENNTNENNDSAESDNDQIQNENENTIKSEDDTNESNNETNDDTINKENEIETLKSEDDEMTDEMIYREEEKYRFHLKLKQFMSNSQTLTTNTVPNYQTIAKALRFNSLPDPKYSKLLDSIIETIQDFKDERIVLLMDSRTQKFKGIYILADDGSMAEKLWGKGPNSVQNDDVSILYKYLDGQKSFDKISSKSFNQTTDGFSLVTKLEHDSW